MKPLRQLPVIIVAAAALFLTAVAAGASSRKRSTTRKIVGREVPAAQPDSIPADSSAIRFSGYDKPLRATKETVFVTNNSPLTICALSFTSQYVDTSGRQLHLVRRKINVDIPPGETRRIDYRSWDVQNSFYYIGSRRPRTSAIPFDIRISPDYVYFMP